MQNLNKSRQIIFIVVTVILAPLLFLTVTELALRVYLHHTVPPIVQPSGWDVPAFVNNPGVRTRIRIFGFRFTFGINQLGLRGPETTLKKPAGTKRILLLGDSVVFGGLVQDSDTLSQQMNAMIPRSKDGTRWEVLNGGVGSYDAWDIEGFLKHKGMDFDPDIVIVGLFMNDHVQSHVFENRIAIQTQRTPTLYTRVRDFIFKSALIQSAPMLLGNQSRAKNPVLRFSKKRSPEDDALIASFFPGDPNSARAIQNFLDKYQYDVRPMHDFLYYAADLPMWDRIFTPMRGIQKMCQARHIPMMVTLFPLQYELFPGYRNPEPEAHLQKRFAEMGIPFVPLRALLSAQDHADELYPSRYDFCHPEAKVYALVAQALKKKLDQLGWL